MIFEFKLQGRKGNKLKVGNNNHTLEGKKLVPELKNSVKTAY
jgi:hypothetical protein